MSAAPACPFCDGSDAVERVGQWGGQIITSQWRCAGCGSYFEALREDYAGGGADPFAEAEQLVRPRLDPS